MSDDDFYDDDGDYAFLDDFSYNEAVGRAILRPFLVLLTVIMQDDLAEHTMHSPVLVNYDPAWETASLLSDWEYYSEDYWDYDTLKKKRGKIGGRKPSENAREVKEEGSRKKRRKLEPINGIPEISLGNPILAPPVVVWKSKKEMLGPFEGSVMSAEQGQMVSLLEDWRERFKIPVKISTSRPTINGMQRTGSQRATAIMIDNSVYRQTTPPFTNLSKGQSLPSRGKFFPSLTAETPSSLSGVPSGRSSQQGMSQEPDQGPLTNGAGSKGRKRKAIEVPIAAIVDSGGSKRKPGRPKKQKVTSVTHENDQNSVGAPTKTRATTGKENARGIANDAAPLLQKRKLLDADDEEEKLSAKRSKSSKVSVEETATVESKRATTRRSTRRKVT